MKYLLLFILLSLPALALGFSLKDGASAYTQVIETHHRMNNMYFYAAIALLAVTIPAVGKLRQGGQMRPLLSRSIGLLVYTINTICILFLVIHFAPETESLFDWVFDFIGRLF